LVAPNIGQGQYSSGIASKPKTRFQNRKALVTAGRSSAGQLKRISIERGISQQALIAEGINYVVRNHGKSLVAS
jgi:hypothetical protein